MQTLQIDKTKARKLFPSASNEFKEMLIDTFGEGLFKEKITDRVKTFEDACEVLGVDPDEVLPVVQPNPVLEDDDKALTAYGKLIIIARALNEGWAPDWNSSNQRKWYPWFQYSGSGFRFADSYFVFVFSAVGSRLCYATEELAIYAAKQFETEYNQFLK